MNYPTASAPARPVSRTLAAIGKTGIQTTMLTAALVMGTASLAIAQQTAPTAPAATAPKPKPPAKKPAAPTAAQPAPVAPAPAPDAQQAPAPGQQAGDQQQPVQLIYSPWTKFCLKNNNDPNAKQVCFTGKDARIESGMPVVAAVLIEPEGEPKKILRVTLPLGMQLIHGTRVIIDQNQPMTAPYVICFTNGCMADYEANPRHGRQDEEGRRGSSCRRSIRPASRSASFCRWPISPRPMTARRRIPKCSRSSSRNCRKSCNAAPTKRARSSNSSRASRNRRTPRRRRRRAAPRSKSQYERFPA